MSQDLYVRRVAIRVGALAVPAMMAGAGIAQAQQSAAGALPVAAATASATGVGYADRLPPPRRLLPINRPLPGARAGRNTSLETIGRANSLSRQAPAPAGFINSAMFYDYMAGAIYEVHASPRFISTIALRPGEKLISKAAGDTVRWVMGETVQGSGPSAQTLVFVKPIKGDLRTNIVLTTNQRTYMLEAISHNSDAYTSIVTWNYPRDQFADAQAAAAAVTSREAQTVAANIPIAALNFGYAIRNVGKRNNPPAWTPERVFDDGSKTYIQFSPTLATTEAPPLFVVGEKGRAELVNYRVQGSYYVVDRLIQVAELRLGESQQQIVRITRHGRGG